MGKRHLGALIHSQRSGRSGYIFKVAHYPQFACGKGFEPDFFQQNLVRIVDDVISVIKTALELWPTLVEISYFQKARQGLPQLRVQNQKA